MREPAANMLLQALRTGSAPPTVGQWCELQSNKQLLPANHLPASRSPPALPAPAAAQMVR